MSARADVTPYQPFTTDTTPAGLLRARNAMRRRLWEDPVFAHRWLVHPNGEPCPDGCDERGVASRVALYTSEEEVAS